LSYVEHISEGSSFVHRIHGFLVVP